MINFELLKTISELELLHAAAMNYLVLTVLFIALTAISNKTDKIFTHEPARIGVGLMFGLFACLSMMAPAFISEGVITDARLPIISFAGIFFGPLAALAATIPPALMRISIGGAGVLTGVVSMLIVMFASASFGYFIRKLNRGYVPFIWIVTYTCLIFPLCMMSILLLPQEAAQKMVINGGPYILLINMVGALLLGYMLCQDQKRRMMMSEMMKLHSKAQEAAVAKSLFMARMSHELRTPMNSIVGFSDLMRLTVMNDEQRYYMDQVKVAGHTMTGLINDILDFSKIDAGKITLKSESFNLIKMLESCKALISPAADAKNIELKLELDTNLPEWAVGDELRLRQVIMNLLANAVKFTDKGHVSIKASVDTIINNKYDISIYVEDTGIGICKDKLRTIFNAFEQVDNSLTRTHGGSGLGLSIAQQFTSMMGGKLQLVSTEGEGSTFRLMLTLHATAPAIALPIKISQDNTPESTESILVVEDIAMNRELVGSMLSRLGYKCAYAENGAEAIEKVKAADFDLVFMDLQMPVMNGYDTTRHIREELGIDSDALPIVAFTAHALPEEIAKCFEAGMDDFLTKPVEFIELASKVDEWLNGGTDGWDIQERDSTSYQNMPLLAESELKNFMSFIGDERLREAYQDFVNENAACLLLIRTKPQDDPTVRSLLHNMTATSGNLGMKKLSLYTQHLLSQGIARDRPAEKAELDLLDSLFYESCRTVERYFTAE